MSQNQNKELFAEAPMGPLIFKMALPAVMAQLVNVLYSIVDRIYIGRIPGEGTEALAGVGLCGTIIILISAFAQFAGGGAVPLASIELGKGEKAKAQAYLDNCFLLLLLFTALTTVAGFIFMRPLLIAIGASQYTLSHAESYLRIYLCGTIFVQLALGLNNFISAQGHPITAMVSVVIGAVLNTILDPIFIFVFGMGISGAAVATIISQAVSAVWILHFLCSEKAALRIRFSGFHPDTEVMKKILALGASPFTMASTESFIGFVMNGSLAAFSDLHVAALTIMQSALQFVSIPLNGFGGGCIPVLSYNYGHRLPKRVKEGCKILFTLMFSVNIVCISLMILFPAQVASLFTADAELIALTKQYMPLFLAGMTIFGLQRSCQNTFVALGQAKISLFIAVLRKIILLIPLVLILPHFVGVSGVYMGEALADAIAACLCTTIFVFRFPKLMKEITD